MAETRRGRIGRWRGRSDASAPDAGSGDEDTGPSPGRFRESAANIAGILSGLALVAVTLFIAFGGGIATARLATEGPSPFGRVAVGPWEAIPLAGRNGADPYTRAKLALSQELPLGQAEGLTLVAETDSLGRRLSASCSYIVRGIMPPARWWSLVPHPRIDATDRPATLSSRDLLRDSTGAFEIAVSGLAQPGNWLALPDSNAPFRLTATLYDTPATRESDLGSVTMPAILRTGCRVGDRSR